MRMQSASAGTDSSVSRDNSAVSIFCCFTAEVKLSLRLLSPWPVSRYTFGRFSLTT